MELATEPLPLSFRAITFHEVSERPRDNREDDGVTSAGTGRTVTHASTLTRSFRLQKTYPRVLVSAVFQLRFIDDTETDVPFFDIFLRADLIQ